MSHATPASEQRPGAQRAAGVLLVLLSAAAFAVGPTAARLAFEDGSNTLTVVAVRGAVGLALTALLIASLGSGFRIGQQALGASLCAGAACTVMSYGFIGSVAYIPVSLAVVVFFSHPLLVAAMWHLLGRERLTARKLVLAAAALVGVALAVGGSLADLDVRGIGLAAVAAVTMCGMIYFSARAQDGATSAQVNFYLTAVTVAVFTSIATALNAWALPSGIIGWLGLGGAGLGITIGLLAFLAAFRFIGAVRATMMSNVEPLFAILFAVALLGERLHPAQWAGVALVVTALLLFEIPPRREPSGNAA
jgi:drug/metabolite transporter (DMT)-like permease